MCYPISSIEDMLVKVGKFYFPADFLVFEMVEDLSMPIILSGGFFNYGRRKY